MRPLFFILLVSFGGNVFSVNETVKERQFLA
jgi:hypothetical protein